MPNYMSPATFMGGDTGSALPYQDWKAGGNRGYEDGRNQGIMEQLMARQFRDSDLENRMQELKYQDEQAQMPSKQAGYDLSTAKSKTEKGLYDDGTQSSLLHAEAMGKLSDVQTKNVKNRLETQLAMGTQAESMDESIKQYGGTMPPVMLKQYKEAWKEAGYPDLPDDPNEAAATIRKYADLHRVSGPRLEAALKNLYQIQQEKAKSDPLERIAAGHDVAHVEGARLAAGATRTTGAAMVPVYKKFLANDPNMTREELLMLGQDTLSKLDPRVNNDMAEKFRVIDSLKKSPEEKARLKDQARDEASLGMYSELKNRLAKFSNQSTSNGAPTSKDLPRPLPPSVKDYEAGQVYDTPKGKGRFKEMRDGRPIFEKL